MWQPPAMDMRCADGRLLCERVLLKVDQGMAVPKLAQGLVEQIRALALGSRMERTTPEVLDVLRSRTPRL